LRLKSGDLDVIENEARNSKLNVDLGIYEKKIAFNDETHISLQQLEN
jgi:hypothetical protein